MKIEEMADVFINSANFAPHAFLTLAPPSGVKKLAEDLSFHMKYLRSSFERKFDKNSSKVTQI